MKHPTEGEIHAYSRGLFAGTMTGLTAAAALVAGALWLGLLRY